jgi:flavin-binding protein dodecin
VAVEAPRQGSPERWLTPSERIACAGGDHFTLNRQLGWHGATMSVAKITEIQSASSKSFEDAIQQGIARAEKTLRNLRGAWIKSQQVVIENGKITEYRVLLKVTFVLQD